MGHFSNFRALTRPEIAALLAQVRAERDPLRIASKLRSTLGDALGRLAAEQVALRTRARDRVPDAEHLFFTRKGLEQASAGPVAAERAHRMTAAAMGAVLVDGSAGIGGDAMALLRAGARLVALEPDERTACILAHNLARVADDLDRAHLPRVVRARAAALAPSGGLDALLLLDPDRRAESQDARDPRGPTRSSIGARERARRPQDWSPTFDACLELLARARGGCLKLPASWTPRDLPSLAPLGALPRTLEWCSLAGEAKELRLWTGVLAEAPSETGGREGTAEPARRVVVLDREGNAERFTPGLTRPHSRPSELSLDEVHGLVELDPALVHAELTLSFAASAGMRVLSAAAPAFPYLGLTPEGPDHDTGPPTSRLYRSWRVVDRCALDRRRARELCRTHGLEACILKTRGLERSADDLARDLGLPRGSRTAKEKQGLLIALGRPEGRRLFLVEPWPGH